MGFGSWLKDKVNDAGDAVEGALDSGEKLLGEGVEDLSHVTEKGLDAVGAHGAADWVRSHGDSLADHLGADVDEMQLGQTDDPKQLVHGDEGKLNDDTSHLKDLAKSFGEVADGLAGIDVADWQGQGGDAFESVWSKTPTDWRRAEDACSKAASALSSYASTVKWAQDQAAEAIRQYNDAKAKQQQAEDDYNAKVDSYNKAVDAHNAGGTAPLPDKPGDFHDPGPALFQAAQDTLDTARKQRTDAANDAAAAIEAATATAPAKPEFTDRMVADASDAYSLYNYQGAHFLGGVMKGTGELIKFGRSLNPTDPYNITHPNEFVASQNQLAAGLVDTAVHPGKLVHSIVGAGWTTDPAEALGKLVPQVALTVGTGGAGAAEGVAERSAIGIGEDVMERGGIEAGENIAERGGLEAGEGAAGDGAGVADRAESAGQNAGADSSQIGDHPGETADATRDPDRMAEQDPVDVATGAVFLQQTDLDLPGVLPLTLVRRHVSNWGYGYWYGPSWSSLFDERIDINDDHVVVVRAEAVAMVYPHPSVEEPVYPTAGQHWPLVRNEVGGFSLTDPTTGQVRHYLGPTQGRDGHQRAFLAAITDPTGHRIAILRDSWGLPTEVRHTGGYRVLVHTDELVDSQRITGLTVVADDGTDRVPVARYGYDQDGLLAEVTNASGKPLRFSYAGGRLRQWEDRNGVRFNYDYDAEGRCVFQSAQDGTMATRFTYTRLSDELSETLVIDSLGAERRYLINAQLKVVSFTDALGNETRSTYDPEGCLATSTDPAGNTTRYRYDTEGNLAEITRPDGSRQRHTYGTAGGRPVLERAELPDGTVWTYDYDQHGNRTAVTDPAGASTRYTYDDHGHLTTVTDALGNTRTVESNPAGLPVALTTPTGATTRIERDPLGRVTAMTDPLGARVELTWTSDNQLARRTLPDGSSETWAYDAEGNQIEHVDPAGRVTRTAWTRFDKPAQVTAPDGTTTSYLYDSELRLTQVTNPQGDTWTYHYDVAGQTIAETDFNGRTLHYDYDRAGRLARRTNGAGEQIIYERDVLGRAIKKRVEQPDGSSEDTEFQYDPLGRLLRADVAEVALVIERDPLGRVLAESVNGRTVEGSYDMLGRRVKRMTPAGVETTWDYGASGFVDTVTIDGHRLDFDRDLVGRETHRTMGDAAVLDQEWDGLGHLTNQRVRTAAARAEPIDTMAGRLGGLDAPASPESVLLQEREYTFDIGGRLVSIDDRLTGTRRFELDLVDRITSIRGNDLANVVEAYAYDELGNITRAAHRGSDAERRHYEGTLLVRSGRDRYTYDPQGRLISRARVQLSRKPEVWHYGWDAEDRLVSVRTPDGTRWAYVYDPLGRRVAKQRLDDNGAVVEKVLFAWDGSTLVEEASAAGTLSWAYDGPRALAQIESAPDNGGTEFYAIVTDLVGTPTELLTADGDLRWHAQHTLWGAPPDSDHAPTPLRFPGQYADLESGLHYNVNRYYNPSTGRYVSQDPLGLRPAPNPSAYVDNPTTWSDPLGLFGCDGSTGDDDMVTVYRGTSHTAELMAHGDTGMLMSDAARSAYFESGGSLDAAQSASEAAHAEAIRSWGSEANYVEAHGAFGTELNEVGPRSMISVTTDPAVAKYFAGEHGSVLTATVPRSTLLPQTLEGAGESEYLIRHMFGAR